jgi:uncharacterized damage-inducible protein DinB
METKWFDRKFDFSFGPDKYDAIYQRLQQAPDRARHIITGIPDDVLEHKPAGQWSVKEQIGHLSVLEPVWRIRFQDIREKKPVLTPADLTNRATSEAGFNGYTIDALLEKFVEERAATLQLLKGIDVRDESRTSLHPRLQQPMRAIDLALFIAEHDDHHISAVGELISAFPG